MFMGITRTRYPDHPHVRGENVQNQPFRLKNSGPSPRARGKRDEGFSMARRIRTIPTCAGKTCCRKCMGRRSSDHPHVRGENIELEVAKGKVVGPSPRARGKPLWHKLFSFFPRTIPTCAGKTRSFAELLVTLRTIPTCAGKTIPMIQELAKRPDHPHVRGENLMQRQEPGAEIGPSPRARGKPLGILLGENRLRTIPTCAGKTGTVLREKVLSTDHPHVRGENRGL